jgi:AcrR family transcriptional regulator
MTKDAIIDAAFRVWGDVLFCKTSLSALSVELGCTKPALYRHFRNKEDILEEMSSSYFDRFSEFLVPRFQEALAADDLNAALVIIAETMGEFFIRNKGEFLFSLVRVHGSAANEQSLSAQLEKRGVDLKKLLGAVETSGEEISEGGGACKTHPSRIQMLTGVVLVMVSQEFFGLGPGKKLWGFSVSDEKPETDIPVFLARLRETVLHGLGFRKERVDGIDYKKLEDAVSLEIEFNSEVDEIHLKLLKAVGEVLAETNPFDASVEMFAKKSGLSKSSLYTHFESREEMILSMFANEFRRIVAIAVYNKAKSAVPEEQVYLVIAAIAQYLQKHTMILRAIDKTRTRRNDFPQGNYKGGTEVLNITDAIFAGIGIPTADGEMVFGKRETDRILFMLVNTLMFRPVEMDYADVGNESIRILFRFLTLGLEGFPDGGQRIKGINTAGQALHPLPAAASAASRGVLNPSFPHSLNHARASTVAISLRSSIR